MKNKKLYYLPGIISIIGLPVLLFIWGPPDPVHEKCITLYLRTSDSTHAPDACSKNSEYADIRNKKIVPLNLNDLTWNEQSAYLHNQKFHFIQREIEKLEFTNDTATVLKISFGTQNNFRSVAWVLNQAMIYNLRQYEVVDDAIYLFPNPPRNQQYASVVWPEGNAPIKMPHQTKWKNFTMTVRHQLSWLFYRQKQNNMLVAGFILLIAIPAIVTMRRYTARQPASYAV